MDLSLSLGYQEQNDNKAIILTDDTPNYGTASLDIVTGVALLENTMYEIISYDVGDDFTATNFGALDNVVGTRFVTIESIVTGDLVIGLSEVREVTPRATEILTATLDTIFTGVTKTPVLKAPIDLAAVFGSLPPPWFNGQSELVYTITSELWGDGVDQLIVDGLYELKYDIGYKGSNSTQSGYGTHQKNQILDITILVYGQVKVAVYDKYRQIPAWCNCQDNEKLHEILEADLCGAYLVAIETSAFLAKTEELLNMLIVLDDMVKNGSKLYY